MKIKAISLWQPWASAMALGLKRNETRSWSTHYRGPLAIHASKKDGSELFEWWLTLKRNSTIIDSAFHLAGINQFHQLPRGCVVAVGRLVDVVRTEIERDAIGHSELILGDYTDGRFAWKFTNIKALPTPIPARGAQGFFDVDVPEEALR